LSLYTLLPATERPAVYLLKQALKEMHEHYNKQDFIKYVTWFKCIIDRTKTMSDEEKNSIKEVLQMQYQIDPLIRENPTIMAIAAESEAKGRLEGKTEGLIEGIQEMILDLVSDRFPALVVSQVQQTIAPNQDIEQLKKFHRQLARISDEQEIPALLTQCFPLQYQIDPLVRENPRIIAIAAESEAKGEAKGLREAILNIVHVRFTALATTTQAQQAIAHIQDIEKLKQLQRDLLLAPDERAARALLELPPLADLL
jgi:predicted transposase YdaD